MVIPLHTDSPHFLPIYLSVNFAKHYQQQTLSLPNIPAIQYITGDEMCYMITITLHSK